MRYSERQKKYNYNGPLRQMIEMYVEKKRSEGLLFNKQAQMFARLDRLSLEVDASDHTLSKKLVIEWAAKRSNESAKNQAYRLNFIKLFAKYMQSQGVEAYCPNYSIGHSGTDAFVPHIFEREELEKLFFAAEHMRKNGQYPNKPVVIPMLIRVLYCCGLRVSEALRLTVADVDLKQGILLIRES